MFPSLAPPTKTAFGWPAVARRGLDLIVAFATLRDAPPPHTQPAALNAATPAGPLPHPHRRALRAPLRSRRPGALAAPAQTCVTPLRGRRDRRGASVGVR